jgi:SecD/SecF fusion protein
MPKTRYSNKHLPILTPHRVQVTEQLFEHILCRIDALVAETGGGRMLSDASLFGTPEMMEKVGFNASNEAIQAEIRRDVEAAIANVFTVLRARIDQFGTTQPNIQRLEGTGRILVELPGVKDPARVKKLSAKYCGVAVLEYVRGS